MIKTSESIAKIIPALIAAKKSISTVGKSESGYQNRYHYASLDSILAEVEPKLSECGLVLSQDVISDGDKIGIATVIFHDSGEFIQYSGFTGPLLSVAENVMNNVQAAGSAITYYRRYAIGAVLCLQLTEDDDGRGGRSLTPNTTKKDQVNNDKKREALIQKIIELGKKTQNKNEKEILLKLYRDSQIMGIRELEEAVVDWGKYFDNK